MPLGYSRLPSHAPPDDLEAQLPAPPSSSLPPPVRLSSPDGLPLPASAGPSSSSSSSFFYPPPPPRPSTLGASRKGKARAIEAVDDAVGPTARGGAALEDGPTGMSFSVRFTDGSTEDVLDLWVGERETVRDVKRRLRLLRPVSLFDADKPRRLRVIQLGRLLPDGVFLVPYTVQLLSRRARLVQEGQAQAIKGGLEAVGRGIGKVVEVVAGEGERGGEERREKGKGKAREGRAAAETEEDARVWLHCSVGEAMDDDEVEGEDAQPSAQITPLQGFDRLRDAGFSEEEIETMRAEFRETRQAAAEDDDEHQRALEEQWMSGMTGQEEATADSSGTGHYVTLLKGVCVGFFMPFLPLFFFRTQIFSRRMQMAIVVGIIINLGFGLLRILG
ncbi:hypothetical protein JCM21900_006096 [Sporobolomyces salmonicolor]